jgi:hypothetical protein
LKISDYFKEFSYFDSIAEKVAEKVVQTGEPIPYIQSNIVPDCISKANQSFASFPLLAYIFIHIDQKAQINIRRVQVINEIRKRYNLETIRRFFELQSVL